MTENDYMDLWRARPELLLPPWWRIDPTFRETLSRMSVDQLVAGRTYVLLARKDWNRPEEGAEGIPIKNLSALYREV